VSADDSLRRVAARVERAGLRVPLTLILDALSPVDVVSSQLARFTMPLVAGTGLAPVAAALADPAAWPELRRLLAASDPHE
jgi:hypothetical protein